jgi:hypothetical protein
MKKKSLKRVAQTFMEESQDILKFFQETAGLKEEYNQRCADYAVILLYGAFETMMLSALAGSINNDSTTISERLGIKFPKHMSEDVCIYLIKGTGYFDFKGRSGLIKMIKEYVPESHYLLDNVKDDKFKEPLERLCALRNFAAHRDSEKARDAAAKAVGQEKIGSAGGWLRIHDRFKGLCESLNKLAQKIEADAPY